MGCQGVKDAEVFDDPGNGAVGAFAVLAVGGDETQIRNAIWHSQPAGTVALVRVVPASGDREFKASIRIDVDGLGIVGRAVATAWWWARTVWCALRGKPTPGERLALRMLDQAHGQIDVLRNTIPRDG